MPWAKSRKDRRHELPGNLARQFPRPDRFCLLSHRGFAPGDLVASADEERKLRKLLSAAKSVPGCWRYRCGTAISGGSFTGFPALIYTYGWVLALWIASYMVVPMTAMVWLGKRLNQVAGPVSGAVTVPDVFRDRFASPALGLVAPS